MKPDDQLTDMLTLKEIEEKQRQLIQSVTDAVAALTVSVSPAIAALRESTPHKHRRLHHRPRGRKRHRGMRR